MSATSSPLAFDLSAASPETAERRIRPSFEKWLRHAAAIAPPSRKARDWWRVKAFVAVAVGLIAVFCGSLFGPSPAERYVRLAAGLIAQVFVGLPAYRAMMTSWRLNRGKLPLAVASVIGFLTVTILSFGQTADETRDFSPLFLALIAFAFAFEADLSDDVADDRASLEGLRVGSARVKAGSAVAEVATEHLRVSDVVAVKAGEMIPRDGVILNGTTSVDEGGLTGEHRPLLKGEGDRVVGGTLNRDGEILVVIKAPRDQDVLEQLIARYGNSVSGAPGLVVRAGVASVTVANLSVLLALVAASLRFFWFHAPWPRAVADALFILAGCCPVLESVAVLAWRGLVGSAMIRGVYFTDGKAADILSRARALFFNKTGTLTRGDFAYSQFFIEPGTNQGAFFSTLFSLEQASGHGLARSSETHPWFVELTKHPVRDVQVHPGLGVSGVVCPRGGREYPAAAGNARFVKRLRYNVSRELKAKLDDLEEMGETVVLCAYDRMARGVVSFSDTLRQNVRGTLRRIQRLGLETVLVTGDTEKTVTQLTGTLGIERIYSRCTPEEKAQKILKEKEEGRVVALVDGDETDAPAIAAADVSLAVDTGTDIAGRRADIVLTARDFSILYWLIRILRRTVRELERGGWTAGGLPVALFVWSFFYGSALPLGLCVNAVLVWILFRRVMRYALDDEEGEPLSLG